jgi:endonuclease YncB( thermonuclease family)
MQTILKGYKIILQYFVVMVVLIPTLSWAWQGLVVGVSDGDTITVMHEGKGEKIRLYGVDCPEKKQAFGKKAKQFTSDMVFKKTVDVTPVNNDRYGRTIAWITHSGKVLNEELLKAGLAWHYKRYSKEQKLAKLEDCARQKRVGLWSDPRAVTPWEFRKSSNKKT